MEATNPQPHPPLYPSGPARLSRMDQWSVRVAFVARCLCQSLMHVVDSLPAAESALGGRLLRRWHRERHSISLTGTV